jgi:hypothetical protein
MSALARAAALSRGTLVIEGETILLREATGPELDDFGDLRKTDKTEALAKLLHACIIGEDGKPAETLEVCRDVAKGSGALANSLLGEIIALGQKKVGTRPDASPTSGGSSIA